MERHDMMGKNCNISLTSGNGGLIQYGRSGKYVAYNNFNDLRWLLLLFTKI